MKRIICLVLCAVMFYLCGCGKSNGVKGEKRVLENRVTSMPSYALKEGATADEMRKTAVRAFREQITVPWYVSEDMSYRKVGAAGDRIFRIKSSQTYGGLPYSNGNTGLLHWLQFYDFDTGEIKMSENDMARNYGNTCASGILWGLTSVCASISATGCPDFVPRNGFYPVGDYDCDYHSLGSTGTNNICKRNGKETMFRAYAEVKPADVLDYNIFNEDDEKYPCHVIMAVEKAHVVYNSDGSINGRKSYVYYQDQHVGITSRLAPFYVREDGTFMHYSGHRYSKATFNWLFENCYVPVTAAEFIGKAEYQKAYVKTDKQGHKTFAELCGDTLRSNYSIIFVNASVKDGEEEIINEKVITCTADVYRGRIGKLKLSRLLGKDIFSEKLESGKEYNIKLEVLVGTGETLTLFDGKITY